MFFAFVISWCSVSWATGDAPVGFGHGGTHLEDPFFKAAFECASLNWGHSNMSLATSNESKPLTKMQIVDNSCFIWCIYDAWSEYMTWSESGILALKAGEDCGMCRPISPWSRWSQNSTLSKTNYLKAHPPKKGKLVTRRARYSKFYTRKFIYNHTLFQGTIWMDMTLCWGHAVHPRSKNG